MGSEIPTWYTDAGTVATGMNVRIHTKWRRCNRAQKVSYHNDWPADVVGEFSIQFSDAVLPADTYTGTPLPADYPSSALSSPTQPTGTADSNILCPEVVGGWSREVYTPTSGGTGVLPTSCVELIGFIGGE